MPDANHGVDLPADGTGVAPSWNYLRVGPGRSGRSAAESNFRKERRGWLAIFMRELLQNALDARAPDQPCVKVTLRRTRADASHPLLRSLVTEEHIGRHRAANPGPDLLGDAPVSDFLVIEDFGTTGLTGTVDNFERDGPNENWNAFWFREGEGGKENGTRNGGAGQGKITIFAASRIRTILALTIRNDDFRELAFGAASFIRDYEYGEGTDRHKWLRDSYWGRWSGSGEDLRVLPVEDTGLANQFRQVLGIRRLRSQPGTTLVIVQPHDFKAEDAVRITLAEFFLPILRGTLAVTIEDTEIDSANVRELAGWYLTDERARELGTCMTGGFRRLILEASQRSSAGGVPTIRPVRFLEELKESVFDGDLLGRLRIEYEEGRHVAVRIPVSIRHRTEGVLTGHVEVHLQNAPELEEAEQACMRRDLLIGDEPVGQGRIRQRVRALTLVGDDALSRLLVRAEEPSHLRWNARLPRVDETYVDGAAAVAIVRNAASRVLELLTGGTNSRDFRSLARFFPAPASPGFAKASSGRGRDQGSTSPAPVEDVPANARKPLELQPLPDGCTVRSTDTLTSPVLARLRFAYEDPESDPFKAYDPYDFDVADAEFTVERTGEVDVTRRGLNEIELIFRQPGARFSIRGFDPSLRLRVRMHYEESKDAESVDADESDPADRD